MGRPATAAVRLLSGEREPVRVATTENIALQGLQTIDGVALDVADRVLVKNQTDGRENGIYTASTGRWYRASDANHPRAISEGVTVQAQDGPANGGQAYRFATYMPNIGDDVIQIAFYLSASFAADAEDLIQAHKADLSSFSTTTVSDAKTDLTSFSDDLVTDSKTDLSAFAQAETTETKEEIDSYFSPLASQTLTNAQRSEAARDIAAGYASDAVSQGTVPIYATIDGMAALSVPVGINAIRVNGRSSVTDQQGGLFVDQNTGSSDTFPSGDGRTWYRADSALSKVFGRLLIGLGDGVANATMVVEAFLSAGGGYVPEGTYLIDDIDVSNPIAVECHLNAVFKRRSAPAGASDLIAFVAGSEGSTWRGGIVDGDRFTHQPSYDTVAKPIWTEMRVRTDDITIEDFKARNALHSGVYVNKGPLDTDRLDKIVLRNIETEDCTTNSVTNVSRLTLDGFHAVRPDNHGMPVDIRGLSVNTIYGGSIDRILVEDMTGDIAVPSPTQAATGILGLDIYDVKIGSMVVRHSYGTELWALCISIAQAIGCTFDYLKADDYCGIGIELVNFDSHLKSFDIDAHYQGPSASTYTTQTSIGLTTHSSWVYPLGNRSRSINRARAAQGLVENGRIRRVGISHDSAAPGLRFRNVRSIASLTQGIKQYSSDATIVPEDLVYEDCEVEFCQSTGVSLRAGSATFVGGRYANNGQDSSLGSTLRAGIAYLGTDPVSKITIPVPPLLEDTQAGVFANAVSYSPHTAAQTYGPNGTYYVCTVTQLSRNRLSLGQNITIGGDAPRTGTIIDINHDELTVKFASAVFLSASGNTAALSGTWTGSGIDLTGVGTLAMAELKEGQVVYDGATYRQVINIVSDTSITVDAPFVTALSVSTLEEISADVTAVASQQFGAYLNNANVLDVQAVGWIGSGNVQALTSFNAATERSGAALVQADVFVSETLTIPDDAAASFTPGAVAGTLIVTDDTNTAAMIVFRATASPLTTLVACTPLGGTATVAVTTGVLTGVTGADAKLTVSAATDGKIYIENRRGASRAITCAIVGR